MESNDGESGTTAHRIPLLRLFQTFLRLGLTGFGGPAMIAYIREVVVRRRGWISDGTFRDGVALCQSIPGATAMQTVAYVGLRSGGPLGAAISYIAFGLPAFVLMVCFSALHQQAGGIPLITSVFAGLQVIVVALMANATLSLARGSVRYVRDAILAGATALFLGLGGPPILAVVSSGAIALLAYRGVDLQEGGGMDAHASTPERQQRLTRVAVAIACVWAVAIACLFFVNRPLFELGVMMTKIDLFAFGGGYASVPLMFHEVVDVRHWLDSKTFMDGIALGQVTPGPIVITATFVGYHVAGILGAIVATLGIFTPSFVVLLAVAPHFDRLRRRILFQRAIRGAFVCFVGLLLAATIRFAFSVPWNFLSAGIAAAALIALQCKVDILWVVLVGACLSAVLL